MPSRSGWRAGLMQDLFTRGVDENSQLRPTPPPSPAPLPPDRNSAGCPWIGKSVPRPNFALPSSTARTERRRSPVKAILFFELQMSGTESLSPLGLFSPIQASHREWTRRGQPFPGDILVIREAPSAKFASYQKNLRLAAWDTHDAISTTRGNHFERFPSLCSPVSASPSSSRRISGGSTVGHVKVGDIRDLAIPFCSDPEQGLITAALKSKDQLLDNDREQLAKLRIQKTGLMQDLLTGKVSVTPLLESAAA